MKTLLIYPPSKSAYGLPRYPTLGIAYLATVLFQQGFVVEVLDMRFPKNNFDFLKKKIFSFQPQIVGVGSTSFDFPGAQKIFRLVKKLSPKTITVLGGPHASICPVADKNIDHLLVGEGEEELPKLIRAIAQEKKVKTIIQAKLIKNLDRLPFPKWGLFPLKDYQVRAKLTLPLATSRGCPYQCVYCVSWRTHGRKFRFRSPKNVVDEIENDIYQYGAKKFSFLDDNFALNPQRAAKICQEIIKRKLKISWTCDQGVRADAVDKKLLRLMKKSGCKLVALGIESADQAVLNKMKKGETVERMKRAIVEAKSVGLIVKAFFIVGSPGDSLKTTKKSIKFFKETNVDIPRFGMMTAYPGSELWQWVKRNGRFLGDPYRYILKSPTASFGAQFETKDFPKKERLKAFALAQEEAEIWAIRQGLIRKLGPFFGKTFLILFRLKFFREMVKEVYRLRIFSVSD